MSATIASFLSSSISGKSGLHPAVGLVFAGLQVASYVASSRLKTPDLPARFDTASRVRLEPTKTIIHTPNASLSLPVVAASTLTIFGLLLTVLALKGFFSGLFSVNNSRDPFDGDGDNPPDPDGGEDHDDDDDDIWFPDMFRNDSTGGGDEPPPPPSLGAACEHPHKRCNCWFWVLFWSVLLTVVPMVLFWLFRPQIFALITTRRGKRIIFTGIAIVAKKLLASFIPRELLQPISAFFVEVLSGNAPIWFKVAVAVLSAYSTLAALHFLAKTVQWCALSIFRTYAIVERVFRPLGNSRWTFCIVGWSFLSFAYILLGLIIAAYALCFLPLIIRLSASTLSFCWVLELSPRDNMFLLAGSLSVFVHYRK